MALINAKVILDFRSDEVRKRVDRKNRRVLVATGAFARTRMRSRMRPGGKKGKVSSPGEYPRAHGQQLLKRLILFGFEPRNESVVIGPELTNQKSQHRQELKYRPFFRGRRQVIKSHVRTTLPSFIDEGGAAEKLIEYQSGETFRYPFVYKPRPFTDLTMGPAMEQLRNKMSNIPL